MKAVRFHEHGGPEVLQYEDVPDPTPKATQVKLRVKGVALNHLDIWLRKGLPGVKVPLPKIGGCDIAGEVAAVGESCTRVQVGERIMVSPGWTCGQCAACLRGEDNLCRAYQIIGGYGMDGGCAEFVCVPEVNCIPIPERMDYPSAAAVPLTFLTAWNMLVRQAQLKAGEDVLIMGAGSGVGTAAIQIAKLLGARVIAVASTDDKLSKASALGADTGINYATQDLGQEVRRVTGKRGVDVVFEHVGAATWERSINALGKNGRLVTCGAHTGSSARLEIWRLFTRQISLIGSYLGTKGELFEVLRLIGHGRLRPVIHAVLPLAEARAAHTILEERRHFGKLLLEP